MLPDFTDDQYAAMAEDAVCMGLRELGGVGLVASVTRAVVGIGALDAHAALERCVAQGRVQRGHFGTYRVWEEA